MRLFSWVISYDQKVGTISMGLSFLPKLKKVVKSRSPDEKSRISDIKLLTKLIFVEGLFNPQRFQTTTIIAKIFTFASVITFAIIPSTPPICGDLSVLIRSSSGVSY